MLPVRSVVRPASLAGKTNGRLPPSVLTSYAHPDGGPLVTLCDPAARSWAAMAQAARRDGVHLRPTSEVDTYRPYGVQERIFRARYSTMWRPGGSVWWNGRRWYKRLGVATAAVPGTSNHGWGLAVDVVLGTSVFPWLINWADDFGWSWELQSERWHLRYYAGDRVPGAVVVTPPPPKPPPPKLNPFDERDDMKYVADQGLVYLVGPGWHRRISGTVPTGAKIDPISNLQIIIDDLEAAEMSTDITGAARDSGG
jgi:hypothetical protein